MVCTAGLPYEHNQDEEYGVDLDDLGDDHSLTRDPTALRIREAAALLDEDVWIAVRLPGGYEGADDLDDGVASARWTTVVTHPDELGWLREACSYTLTQRTRTTWNRCDPSAVQAAQRDRCPVRFEAAVVGRADPGPAS